MADKVAESVNDGVTSISNLARNAAGGSDNSLDPQIQAREGIFYGSLIYVFKFVSLIRSSLYFQMATYRSPFQWWSSLF